MTVCLEARNYCLRRERVAEAPPSNFQVRNPGLIQNPKSQIQNGLLDSQGFYQPEKVFFMQAQSFRRCRAVAARFVQGLED
jgi:hypothetical protein